MMTVDELIEKLAQLPGDTKVIVTNLDPYGEYLVYNEVTGLSLGQHQGTITGGKFKYATSYSDEIDSVLLH